jgi:hypothetical protein
VYIIGSSNAYMICGDAPSAYPLLSQPCICSFVWHDSSSFISVLSILFIILDVLLARDFYKRKNNCCLDGIHWSIVSDIYRLQKEV